MLMMDEDQKEKPEEHQIMEGESIKTRIIILNEADNWLADKITDSPGQKVTVEANVDAPGWYYIGVMDLEGKTHEDPYVFRVTLER